jgi:21S rRNA (GM2251-2'-O)-methyltransferase
MVYSCLSSSTLLRSHQLVTPRTFLRYKSITAAIERGRQGGPDRSFRPRTRTDRTDERDDPVKTRREARFERFGPPRDEPEPKFGDRSTATPRSSRFGRIPRDDDAPSRFNEERRGGFGGERRSSFWGERRSSFGGERRSGLSRDSQGGFGRERQNDFGRERRGTDFEQRPESTTDPKVASQTRVYKRKPLSPDALDNKGNLIAETGASGVADRSPTRREAFSERGEQGRPRRLTNDRNDSRRQGTWRDDSAPSYTPRPRGARDEGVRESRFSPRSSATRDDDATSYIPRSRDTDDRSFEPRFSHRPDSKGARRERHGRESSDVGSGTRGEVEAQKTFVRGPESLPYTTAASEFIYGHMSVVAAMKANRRKFYNLYVHSRGASRDGLMSRIRAHKLFPITHEVGDEYMRALDKASSGRPHNGVILEASPLPVPPITELKTASIEDESFSVGLDSQSAEDVIVNGKQELYSYKSGGWRHPLILYVDGVVSTALPPTRWPLTRTGRRRQSWGYCTISLRSRCGRYHHADPPYRKLEPHCGQGLCRCR